MSLISLEYGSNGRWEGDLSSERLLFSHPGPAPIVNPLASVLEGVQQPIEFPALELAMVPGDRVVIVLDRAVPSAAEIKSGIWSAFVCFFCCGFWCLVLWCRGVGVVFS